jgi:predicted nucleic-acid-binding protein
MIGVDTNVVLRLFVVDDEEQHSLAVSFFSARSSDDPAYVNLLVVAELVWLLQRRYGFAEDRIFEVLHVLLESVNIVVERSELVEDLIDSSSASHKVSIADLLISQINRNAGCATTKTFDVLASKRIPGMELLA